MASVFSKTGNQRSIWISHLCALLVVTVWGASFVSTKVLTNNGLGAVEIYIYRFIFAYLLTLLACHNKLFANNWRDELMFAVCGMCGGSIYFIAENTAIIYTRVSDVSMLTTLAPLLTTLLVGALYKSERPTKWTYISSLIALAGVACIVFKDGFNSTADAKSPDTLSSSVGQLLALGAALSWAIYSIVLRKLNVTYSAQFITRKTFFYGLITALPFWIVSAEPMASPAVLLRPEVLGNFLFLGVICSMGAYILWSAAMHVLGAVATNNYLYIQPIATMIIAACLFGKDDPITVIGCFGAVLIIGGLWFGDHMNHRQAMRGK